MKIYSRKGDDGTSSLPGRGRVPKHHPCLRALGDIDELISWTGLLRELKENSSRREFLKTLQEQLMASSSLLAGSSADKAFSGLSSAGNFLSLLENEIDIMEAKLPQLNSFVLPGGSVSASWCHIARCVCRRAERSVSELGETCEIPESLPALLNRISDYLFILSRSICYEFNNEEDTWSV